MVRILQTDESQREWTAEGCRGGAATLGRQGQGSQDIYLVQYAIRGQLSGILAAVKLLKTTTVLPSYPRETDNIVPDLKVGGRKPPGVGIL